MTRTSTCRTRLGAAVALLAIASFPAASSAQSDSGASQGKALFQAKCAACHTSGTERLVGPGLGDVAERRERVWLIDFITGPDRVIASGDSIAVRLVAEYGMPMPNLGVTPEQAAAILDYLSSTPATAAEPAASGEPAANAEPAAGDPAVGRQLFTGKLRLANGGGACISCHSVPRIGGMGGGTLAKDLTGAAKTYGAGLPQFLSNPPFPLMQAVYGPRPLTQQEIAHLSAFLEEVAASGAPAERRPLPFPAAGLGGMVLLVALAGVIWRGRLRGVRKPLMGEGR